MFVTITAPAPSEVTEGSEWERIGSPWTVDYGTGLVETVWSHADEEDFAYWESRTVLHTPEYWTVLESAERSLTQRVVSNLLAYGETRRGRKLRAPLVAALAAIRAERSACR